MPKKAEENVRTSGVMPEREGSFYADMANGLHALAQPLTILRTAMAAATLPGGTPDHQRLYLDISAEQVERACTLFQCLQQLVTAREVEADCAPIDLAEMLAPVLEDPAALVGVSGVTLKAEIPEGLGPVIGDMDRTLESLFALLKIAGSVSSPGDVIELLVASAGDSVELTVQNRRSHENRLSSSDRLTLSLAEANIRSQRGGYKSVDDPFCVSFTLPLQTSGGIDSPCAQDEPHDAHALQCHS